MNERRSAEYTVRMCALDSFYLLVHTQSLCFSLSVSHVSCFLSTTLLS